MYSTDTFCSWFKLVLVHQFRPPGNVGSLHINNYTASVIPICGSQIPTAVALRAPMSIWAENILYIVIYSGNDLTNLSLFYASFSIPQACKTYVVHQSLWGLQEFYSLGKTHYLSLTLVFFTLNIITKWYNLASWFWICTWLFFLLKMINCVYMYVHVVSTRVCRVNKLARCNSLPLRINCSIRFQTFSITSIQ